MTDIQLSIHDLGPAPIAPVTVADLWEIYYPGRSPEQVYRDARRDQSIYGEHLVVIRKITDTFWDRDEDGRVAYWAELAQANRALNLHLGVPEQYIGDRGRREAPVSVCRYCWRPGADTDDWADGVHYGLHTVCAATAAIRCDLRCSVSSRILWGDEERAAMWEQRAVAAHEKLTGVAG